MTITKETKALLDRYEEKIRDLELRLEAACDMANDVIGYTSWSTSLRDKWLTDVKKLREGK